jgi:alanine racemase
MYSLADKNQIFMPIVKANAYGHGDVVISKVLRDKCNANCFGVGTIDEALRLRKAGIEEAIYLLGPVYDKDALDELWNSKITPIVSDRVQLEKLVTEKNRKWNLHLKFDTGMHRLGFSEEDIDQIVEIKNKNKQISITGVCSHLLKSNDFGVLESHSDLQLSRFRSIQEKLSKKIIEIKDWHLFNSDGLLSVTNCKSKEKGLGEKGLGVRPGIALYGYSSLDSEWSHRLKPVMTLKTSISHFTKVLKGKTVSYNGTWTAKRDSLIATLPIGYADGYKRSLSNKGHVYVLNQVVPIVGTVCMDYIMIDVSDITKKNELVVGTEVELFGNHVKLGEVSHLAGTITYEILAGLGQRVNRNYNYEGEEN